MPKPYYDADGITIYHGDCAEILPSLGRFDMVFTSPPFNLGASPWPNLGNWKNGDSANKGKWANGSDGVGGITYTEHDDAMPWPEYEAWQQATLRTLWDHLTDAGAIFYNHKPRLMGGKLWLPLALNPNLPLRQIVIWARSVGLNYIPPAFVPTLEWIMICATGPWRLKSRAAAGIGGGDVWRVTQDRNKHHPAPFPVALPALAIEAAAPTSLLDPFVGSGSTLVAARNAGISAVGVEKSERYCEVAAKRLSEMQLGLEVTA